MILRNLTLDNYGRFHRLSLDFCPGLTIIKGPNEAGKSTLQSALMLALFGDPRSRSQSAGQRRRWGQDQYYSIALHYDFGDASYLLEKDFESRKERLCNCSTGEEITSRDAMASAVYQALGISSEELFRATACVTQDNIARISGKGRQQVSEQLQSVITGGAGDTAATKCVELLRAKAAELRRGVDRPATNPGLIKQSRQTVSRLQTDLEVAETQMTRLQKALDTAEETAAEMEVKSERLSALKSLLTGHDRRVRLYAARDEAAKNEDVLQTQSEAIESLQQIVAEKGRMKEELDAFSQLPADSPQTLAKLDAVLEAQRAAVSAAQEDLAKAAESRSSKLPLHMIGLGAAALVVIAVLCLFFDAHVPGVLALLGSGALLLWRQSIVAVAGRSSDRTVEAQRRVAHFQSQVRSAADNLNAFLSRCGCESTRMFQERWAEWTSVVQALSNAESELSGRLSGRNADDIDQERRRWSKARRDAEEQLTDTNITLPDLTPLQRQEYELECSRLEDQIADLSRRNIESRAIIDSSRIDLLDKYAIEESLAAEQERMNHLERLARVYSTAAEGIEDAVVGTLRDGKERLQSLAGDHMSFLTGGRYNRVEVDERSLGFHVYSDEKGDVLAADGDELSRGTVDQFYLAVRLALLDVICAESRPPLLLDDPFVTYDDDRMARAMELCKNISRERQVILFTCSSRYDCYADQVVNLPHKQ